MQEEAWSREDNAVQRRKEDLLAAGLSPVLAAGSAATTMAPIRIEAPQLDTAAIANAGKSVTDGMMTALAMKQGAENITRTQAETANIEAQRDKTVTETEFMKENNPTVIEQNKTARDIANATKPANIERAFVEVKGVNLDNANKALDTKIKNLQISNAEVDLVKNKISVTAARMGIPEKALDIVSKGLLLILKKMNLKTPFMIRNGIMNQVYQLVSITVYLILFLVLVELLIKFLSKILKKGGQNDEKT